MNVVIGLMIGMTARMLLLSRSKPQSRKRHRQLLDGRLHRLRLHFGGAVCPHWARAPLRGFARVFDLAGGHLDELGLQDHKTKAVGTLRHRSRMVLALSRFRQVPTT